MPSSVRPEEQDQSMVDVQEQQVQDENKKASENRITVLSGGTETAASFQFQDEGHTLGNALRYVIMKNPDVEFCGYTIPHPSEAKMNLRIQTYENTTALEALQKGLDDLEDLCDVVQDKFVAARDDYDAEQANEMTV